MNHAVITGGTGGLGSAISKAFCGPNWSVAGLGRRDFDLRDSSAISTFFQNRSVDLLVCAAGITRDAPLARINEESWDEMIAVNFEAAANCAQAVLPEMKNRKTGHIVFISSFSALRPPIGQIAYATAKAAILGLTHALAEENGKYGIRINAILPGFLETRMTENIAEKRRSEIRSDHFLNRFNTPKAAADFIHFLHHSLPHTSGQIFQLDSRKSVGS